MDDKLSFFGLSSYTNFRNQRIDLSSKFSSLVANQVHEQINVQIYDQIYDQVWHDY